MKGRGRGRGKSRGLRKIAYSVDPSGCEPAKRFLQILDNQCVLPASPGRGTLVRGKQNSKGSLSLCQKVLACRLWEQSRLDGDSAPSTSVTLPHV